MRRGLDVKSTHFQYCEKTQSFVDTSSVKLPNMRGNFEIADEKSFSHLSVINKTEKKKKSNGKHLLQKEDQIDEMKNKIEIVWFEKYGERKDCLIARIVKLRKNENDVSKHKL